MSSLHGHVRSGKYKGKPLFPHKHKDGMYVATTSRYEDDYIRVETTEELETLVKSGYGARMSNPDIKNAPSYIIHEHLSFDGSIKPPSAPKELLPAIVNALDLDKDSKSKSRKEQSFLRAHLIGDKKYGNCILCQHEFPFNMLVAAHLKKRSVCTNEEKLDFDNVAALMCKTGCDDLYEKNYIHISEGVVKKNTKCHTTARLDKVISNIFGNKVPNWVGSKEYYEWHRKKFNK